MSYKIEAVVIDRMKPLLLETMMMICHNDHDRVT